MQRTLDLILTLATNYSNSPTRKITKSLETIEILFIRMSQNPSFKTISAWRRKRADAGRGRHEEAQHLWRRIVPRGRVPGRDYPVFESQTGPGVAVNRHHMQWVQDHQEMVGQIRAAPRHRGGHRAIPSTSKIKRLGGAKMGKGYTQRCFRWRTGARIEESCSS